MYAVRSSDSLGSRFSAIGGFSLLCDSDTGRVRGYQGQAEGEDRRQDHQLPHGLSPQARVLWRYVTGVVSQGRLILVHVHGTDVPLLSPDYKSEQCTLLFCFRRAHAFSSRQPYRDMSAVCIGYGRWH